MKYGESAFDILYLIFAITGGCLILRRAGDKTEKYMGLAALILGCGDAFHLIPRVMNYFSDADFTAALGIGKLITSISMTVFYLLLYKIWLGHYRMRENQSFTNRCRSLPAVLSEETKGQSVSIRLALYPPVISVLYSGCSGSGTGPHAGHADASQNHLLYIDDRCFPAFSHERISARTTLIQGEAGLLSPH